MVETMPPQNCRSCGRPVFWVTYEKTGKAQILDVEPRQYGTRFRHPEGRLTDDQPWRLACLEEIGYASHFSTCPFANEHRRRNP